MNSGGTVVANGNIGLVSGNTSEGNLFVYETTGSFSSGVVDIQIAANSYTNATPTSVINTYACGTFIGETGNIGQSNYAATKSGMYGFTRSLARELAKDNIRVNAISPGFVETDMLHTVPPDLLAGIKDEIPLGRFGYADEIALAVLYLCSPAGSWITGTNLSINGGHNML